ncbi:MAG: hypothetical protein H6536_08890 [Bacteroidales bacterium]|nr:hypothetical protein [Bacteroidales bacterium]
MKPWLKILIILAVLPCRVFSNVDNFEGKIKILKEGVYDTIQLVISVKGDAVRIDEVNRHNAVQLSYLINLKHETIVMVSHCNKVYTEVVVRPAANDLSSDVEFIRTQNTMVFNGDRCVQWRVRDRARNTELTYWVVPGKYNFMKPLVDILSRSDTPLSILGYFPMNGGYLPMLTVERTIFRKIRATATVVDIKSQKLLDDIFAIPLGFRECRS